MYRLHNANCFDWIRDCPPQSLHAVCTDPPYGLLEFTEKEVTKLRAGRGGVWRLPPTIGGSRRDPLPRFTVLNHAQKENLARFFHEWGKLLLPALKPGAHVCVAGHPIMEHLVQSALAEAWTGVGGPGSRGPGSRGPGSRGPGSGLAFKRDGARKRGQRLQHDNPSRCKR